MILIKDKSCCNGCHSCVDACPKRCIEMRSDEEGFLYPFVDQTQCLNCGICEAVCPLQNGKTNNAEALQIGYVAYNNDQNIRMASSSGGIFTLLAMWILSRGGVVFGAAMSEDCKSVHHIAVETPEELVALRGSKYVQSRVEGCYCQAREFLDAGRPVLFTGTPCQIGGLLSLLNKEYDNLYTQDIICHGVPSPLVWQKYVILREKTVGAQLKTVSFRSKVTGWKNFSMSMQFENGTSYANTLRSDPFLRGFLSNIYLRPSCYSCAFKTRYRQSDLTLADFWGIQHLMPAIDDDCGTSAVWVHTKKGNELFQQISSELTFVTIDTDQILSRNSASLHSAKETKLRKRFWMTWKGAFSEKLLLRMTRKPLAYRVMRKISSIKRKLL